MKKISIMLFVLTLILTACSLGSSTPLETVPTLITVEVTRLVLITSTPGPATQVPVLDDIPEPVPEATGGALLTGDCYQTATTQLELNACAQARQTESEAQMIELLKRVEAWYMQFSEEDYQVFQQLQTEWQDLARRECEFQSGAVLIDTEGVLQYKGGSIAPLNFSECLVQKYEDRVREFQNILAE